ncbi:hypothetical protein [Enterococcus faecium]|uniref:hypothetical protein n=1 Tax=Enterococcus faecium TaxID=1352 RepID=UPI0035DFF7A7
MSEFKEKVLSEISFAMVDDAPDLQKLYDKVAATDEHSELNDNQKIVLEWLEEYYAKSQWPFPFYVLKHAANDMSANIFGFYDDFTMKEEFEVLAAFAQWGLEQEEAE